MTDVQKYLVKLLKSELDGLLAQPPESDFDWATLLKLAVNHGILGALYPQVENLLKGGNEQKLLTEWKNLILHDAAYQACATEDLLVTLEHLNQSGIHYLLVKGLVIKQLYAQPEYRHMKDADLIIDNRFMPNAIELLTKLGYTMLEESKQHPSHFEMVRPFGYSIELHFSLCNGNILVNRDTSIWEKHVWANTRSILYDGITIPVFSVEDELIHLIVHLSTHFVGMDVNLQKIYDIALFLKKYNTELDITYVNSVLEKLKLLSFFQSFLAMLRDLFGLSGDYLCSTQEKLSGEMLLEDLLSGHGLKNVKDHITVSQLQWYCHADLHHNIKINHIFLIFLIPLQLLKRSKNPFECIVLTYKTLHVFRERMHLLKQAGIY